VSTLTPAMPCVGSPHRLGAKEPRSCLPSPARPRLTHLSKDLPSPFQSRFDPFAVATPIPWPPEGLRLLPEPHHGDGIVSVAVNSHWKKTSIERVRNLSATIFRLTRVEEDGLACGLIRVQSEWPEVESIVERSYCLVLQVPRLAIVDNAERRSMNSFVSELHGGPNVVRPLGE